MKNPEELVGKVVKIEDIHYLVDKVAVSDGTAGSVQKFVVTLITLDFLTVPNQKTDGVVDKITSLSNVKGFTFRISAILCNDKLRIVKAVKDALGLGLKEAKDLVFSMEQINETPYYFFKYEFPKVMVEGFSCLNDVYALRLRLETAIRKELQCNVPDVFISIY